MISKELKRLSRRELVDIIYQLKKNEQKLQEDMAALEESIQEKRIRISVAGSIAEAAMDITNIFSTAQRTADLYLREISYMKTSAEEECSNMLAKAKETAAQMLADSKQQCEDMQVQYQSLCQKYQQLQAEMQRLEER